ncbi:MAG TPA: phosphoadenylyl-sulfate reductase [Elusimicrobiota bacterium]|nr:phosphoadenylyl-sulfate reductase [Elusimicrobiota bacterium]
MTGPRPAAAAASGLSGRSAEDVLAWSLERFATDHLVLASSFGPEDVVLIDMFAGLGRFPRVATLDTGRLPQETHDVVEAIRGRYALKVETLFPDAGRVAELVDRHGPNLFYESVELRRLCCRVRKVEPLRRALAGAEAWITGLRREQSADRAASAVVEWDAEFGLTKLNPLAEWSSDDVWARIRERGLPYNRLHDAGYPSVGCAPCSRAVQPGDDPRSGRWWWESASGRKECGLHK